jgi:hypothetical protein
MNRSIFTLKAAISVTMTFFVTRDATGVTAQQKRRVNASYR